MAGGFTGDPFVDCLPTHAADTYSNSDACSYANTTADSHTYAHSHPNTMRHSIAWAKADLYSYSYTHTLVIANLQSTGAGSE